jgi:hypothetical protein
MQKIEWIMNGIEGKKDQTATGMFKKLVESAFVTV